MLNEEKYTLHHGSKVIVEIPEVRIGKYTKDFGYGFYCTIIDKQAKRWAAKGRSKGYVSRYEFAPNYDLKIMKFDTMTEEWLDFIINCRAGGAHEYDIVEGPMADDEVYDHITEFLEKRISREAFWALAKFKHPTHQISFHTQKALETIKYKDAEEVTRDVRFKKHQI
ncbi:MAG: DUF3990 domain-containing protein [Cellulosilyticaceae bacterium]